MSQTRPTLENEFVSAAELPTVFAELNIQNIHITNTLTNMANQNLLRRTYIEVFKQKPVYLRKLSQIPTFNDETYQAVLLNLPPSLAAISEEHFMLEVLLEMQQKKLLTNHYIQLMQENALFRDLLVEMSLRSILTADYITAFLNRYQANWQEKIDKDFAYKKTVRAIAFLHEKGISSPENQNLVFNSIAPEECANAIVALGTQTYTPQITQVFQANLIQQANPVAFVAVFLQLAQANLLITDYINFIASAKNPAFVAEFIIKTKPDPFILKEKLKINSELEDIATIWDIFTRYNIPTSYFDQVLALKPRPEGFLGNLRRLHKANILNPTTFAIISKINYLLGGWFDEKNQLLTEESLQLIITSPTPQECGYAIYDLYVNDEGKKTLYTPQHLKLLAAHTQPREFVKGLCHLQERYILCVPYVTLLSTSSQPVNLAHALFTFDEFKLSTVVTAERIASAKVSHSYASAIHSLHNNVEFRNKVLSLTPDIDQTLFQHEQPWSLILVLKSLFRRNVLTAETLQKSIAIADEKIETLHRILETLDSCNIAIDNPNQLFDSTWRRAANIIISALMFSQICTEPNLKAAFACQDISELSKRIDSYGVYKTFSQPQFMEFLKPKQYSTQTHAALFTPQPSTDRSSQSVASVPTEAPRLV